VTVALLLDVLIRHDPISVDFHTYVAASEVVLERGWTHIYDTGLVGIEQKELAPGLVAQPFLSPPTVALLTIPLVRLPLEVAYVVWALVLFGAFAAALAWAGVSNGLSRWIAVVGALAPWWVMHAINVGQVVPLVAALIRVMIVAAVMGAAYKLPHSPGMVVPIAIVGSLVISPYLHASDLCMLAAAGWMVWEERTSWVLRIPLATVWVLASPYLYLRGQSPHLRQWPWLELALLLALLIAAWLPLTAWA